MFIKKVKQVLTVSELDKRKKYITIERSNWTTHTYKIYDEIIGNCVSFTLDELSDYFPEIYNNDSVSKTNLYSLYEIDDETYEQMLAIAKLLDL